MPVRFDDYERHADAVEWWPAKGTNGRRILTFLLDHPETGFTPTEIADATGVPQGSIGPTLLRLLERDLVRHEEPYWAVATNDRIAVYEDMLRSLEALEAADGDDGWADVDPSDYEVDDRDREAWRRRSDEST